MSSFPAPLVKVEAEDVLVPLNKFIDELDEDEAPDDTAAGELLFFVAIVYNLNSYSSYFVKNRKIDA